MVILTFKTCSQLPLTDSHLVLLNENVLKVHLSLKMGLLVHKSESNIRANPILNKRCILSTNIRFEIFGIDAAAAVSLLLRLCYQPILMFVACFRKSKK